MQIECSNLRGQPNSFGRFYGVSFNSFYLFVQNVMSVDRVVTGEEEEDVKKISLTCSPINDKQRLLSIDMKTEVVQNVLRIKLDNLTT